MHQITACSLYKLIQSAYTDYFNETDNSNDEKETLSFDGWCESHKLQSPQFQF